MQDDNQAVHFDQLASDSVEISGSSGFCAWQREARYIHNYLHILYTQKPEVHSLKAGARWRTWLKKLPS
jgi:hypothetical protein